MKHNAKVQGLLAVMMVLTLALVGCQGNPSAVVGPHVNVNVDGVWGIPEQGTDKQGANFDRWATGPGGSPSAISDTDPAVQNQAANDENHIRYGAQDTNDDPPPPLLFADQSGFGFKGASGISMPTDGTVFKLGTFTHYNGVTNVDLADYNPLENVRLTITLSGSVNAVLKCNITLDETINDEVPCRFPDAPNDPPCGERVMLAPQPHPTTIIAIEGKQYSLEIVGFADCKAPGFPNRILYTHEMAADKADLYAWIVALPTPLPPVAEDRPAATIAAVEQQEDIRNDPRVISALELLEVWIDSQLAYEHIPGISVAIVHDQDLLWSRGFGYADLERKVAVSPQTIFSICSVSKLFTSIAVMQLRDAGKLNLDDPIEKHLPWFDIQQTYTDAPPATVRGLLTHTSGLPREASFPYWTGPTFPFPTREAMMEHVNKQHTLYPTDRYFQYSNLGMALLGEIVAAASGMSYDSYIRQRILEPLGMTDTTTDIPLELAGEQLATGYTPLDRSGQRHKLALFQARAIAPAAGYASTVEDLGRFAAWQFSLLDSALDSSTGSSPGASILRPSTLREMHRVHRVDPELFASEGSYWGLGFGIYPEDGKQTAETTLVGHGGACPGFRTSLKLQPDTKFAAIAMINAEGAKASPGVITRAAHKIVGKAIAEALESPDEASAADPALRRYTGLYATVAWGEFAVVIWGDQLATLDLPTAKPMEGLTKLKKTGEHRFRRVRDDGELGEEFIFELENDTVVRMWQNNQYSTKVR